MGGTGASAAGYCAPAGPREAFLCLGPSPSTHLSSPPTHQGMVLSAEYIKKKLEQEMVLSQAFGRDLVRRVPRRGALAAPSPPAPQREIGERMEPPLRTRLPHFPWTPGSRHPHLLSSSCPL